MLAPIGERRNSGRAASIGGGWLLLVALTGCRMLPPPPCDSVARITIPRVESEPALREIGPLSRTAVLPASYEKESGEMPEGPLPPLPLEPGGEPELVEPGGWRLEPLEAEALARHPGVAAAAARVAGLRGKWLQAGLGPNPNVGYGADEVGNEGSAGLHSAYLRQEFLLGGKLDLNRRVVNQEIRAAEQLLATRRWQVLTDVRTRFYDTLVAQRRREISEELVSVAEQAVRTSRQLLDAGEIPRIGLLQAEMEARQAHLALRRSEVTHLAAWRGLASLLGDATLPAANLLGEWEPTDKELEWETARERLLSQSPEITAALAEVERARWRVVRAQAEISLDPSVQLGAGVDEATGDPFARVQFEIPLRVRDRNQGNIQQACAELVEARHNLARVELDLQQRLAAAFGDYATAHEQVRSYARELLPRAGETLKLVAEGFKRGELGYLDMLSAQRTFFQTNLEYVESLRGYWRARLLIEGLLLQGSLSAQP